jgi:low affinity Fe/Cu permease
MSVLPGSKAGEPPRPHGITPYPAKGAFARLFTAFANWTAHASGMPLTFLLALLVVVAWAVSGPLFQFSDTWQLVINTGTTIVTFLMVFLIQNTQNRDGLAIQVKLDEIVRALKDADNKIVGIENLTEAEVRRIRDEVVQEARADGTQPEQTPPERQRSNAAT